MTLEELLAPHKIRLERLFLALKSPLLDEMADVRITMADGHSLEIDPIRLRGVILDQIEHHQRERESITQAYKRVKEAEEEASHQ